MSFTTLVLLGLVAAVLLLVFVSIVPKFLRQQSLKRRYDAASVTSRGVYKWTTLFPPILLLAAAACLVLAFGQFRLSREAKEATVVMAIDVSDSMDQTDVHPSRMTAAQDAAQAFVEKLPQGYRVGLVTFAGKARVAVVPSAERAGLQDAISSLTTSRGTVIGDGLTAALDTIEADRSANGEAAAAVVLLSDGADTGSQIDPEQAAERAHALGVPVFTVVLRGAGDPDTSAASGTPETGSGLLEQVSATTGAQTFSAQSAGELSQVYETLGAQLSYDLAVSGSAKGFLLLAALLGIAAGLAALVVSKSE
jgi:Ca-activated chloride channel family protein